MIEFSYFIAFIFALVACIRLLHLNSRADWPELFANGSRFNFAWALNSDGKSNSGSEISSNKRDSGFSFVTQILQQAPIFSRPYISPLIWGRSGHLQTIIHSTLGRFKTPRDKGDSRHSIILSDGSTVTFDLFLPQSSFSNQFQDVTLVICPGIGNSSESMGIRNFSHLANSQGYRVAVLNHLGVIPHIPLTSPRMFSYGSTEEYGAVVDEVISMYPGTTLIAVGFSMGANLVCKYLGESPHHRSKIAAAISCCQGYDIYRSLQLLQTWRHMRYGYLRAVYICVKKVLQNFQKVLLSDDVIQKYGLGSRERLLSFNNLIQVDNIFLSKLAGYKNVDEYYRLSSCAMYMSEIDIPILFINSKDDPLIPTEMFDIPLQHTGVNNKALFVVTKHGGHLGYYECEDDSRLFTHGTYTWLDKAVVQYISAALLVTAAGSASS